MKKISVKGLADFMTASAATQRKIVHEYKYPKDDEARAKTIYYRETRDRISVYHASGHLPTWLTDEAASIGLLADGSIGKTKTRLKHNRRALIDYKNHFCSRGFVVLDDRLLTLKHHDVLIKVYPDLHVEEKGREKFIKLEFGVNEPSTEVVKIISQVMFESCLSSGLTVKSSDVLYLDVPRGKEHKGARMGAMMKKNIEAACKTFSAIWDSI